MRAFERLHSQSQKLTDASSDARAAGSVRALHGNDPTFWGFLLLGWFLGYVDQMAGLRLLGRLVSDRFVKSAVTPFPVRIDPLSCSIPTSESRSLSGFCRPRLWVVCYELGDLLSWYESLSCPRPRSPSVLGSPLVGLLKGAFRSLCLIWLTCFPVSVVLFCSRWRPPT